MYLRKITNFLGVETNEPTPIFVDNDAARLLSENPTTHTRAKHIDIRYHFNRDVQERKEIAFEKISSEENLADLLTKAVSAERLKKLSEKMGIEGRSWKATTV